MSKMIKVASAQISPVFMNLEASVARAIDAIKEAGRSGAGLIAFPETWLPGFPSWIFTSTGWKDPRHKAAYAHLVRNSVQVGDEVTQRLCLAARENAINVVIGVNERDGSASRSTLYNSLLFISDEGVVLGVRRKLKPTHAERVIWGQGDGSGIQVYETSAGRVGGTICWEHWMPLNRFAMHSLGEEVHIAAWPDVAEHNVLASRGYAFEGRCFVIASGMILKKSDITEDFGVPVEALTGTSGLSERDDYLLAGGTGIIGPDGRWIVDQTFYDEKIVYGDIDLERVVEEKLALDTAGHYNRPDIFKLSVDGRAKEHVVWRGVGEAEPIAHSVASGFDAPGSEQLS